MHQVRKIESLPRQLPKRRSQRSTAWVFEYFNLRFKSKFYEIHSIVITRSESEKKKV